MKKHITILVFLFFSCLFTWSQKKIIKTATPCNDELLKKTPGLWIHAGERSYAKISKQQQQEIFDRIDEIHQFVFANFPSPLGIDGAWWRSTSDAEFGQQVRIDHFPGGKTNESLVNGVPVVTYSYLAKFYQYGCGRDKYEIMRGFPAEGGASVEIFANQLNIFGQGLKGMQIEERNIQMMPPVKGKWKGYTLYYPEPGSGITMVLLHREGMLPYKPVTRKQYLDLSISYLNKWYDKVIEDGHQSEKIWAEAGIKTDPQVKKEQEEKLKNQKKNVIKHYEDEVAATTAAGLLNTPAIIAGVMCDVAYDNPIFTTETEGGKMLVTENPAYFRKDLPKYIPQTFVLLLERPTWSFAPREDPIKVIEEKFPIEKLQSMIDK